MELIYSGVEHVVRASTSVGEELKLMNEHLSRLAGYMGTLVEEFVKNKKGGKR